MGARGGGRMGARGRGEGVYTIGTREASLGQGGELSLGDLDGGRGCSACLRHNNTIHWAQTWVLTPL